MSNVSYFKSKIREYCRLFDLTVPNMKQHLCCKNAVAMLEFPCLYYNVSIIEDMSKASVLATALHEVAHIKFEHYMGDFEDISKYDREAEFWAYEIMEKYEPNRFLELQKELE